MLHKPANQGLRRGDRFGAAFINRVASAILSRLTVKDGYVKRVGSSWVVALNGTPAKHGAIPIKITDSDGAAHAWVQVHPNNDGTFSDLTGGRSGTTTVQPAYEVNGRQDIPADTIVLYARPATIGVDLIWLFDLGLGPIGSEATVGTTAETEAAQSDTWDITNQPSNLGVTLTAMTRIAYDDTGDETLYAYYRDLTFASLGALTSISAETRVTVDTPEAC